MRASRGTRLSRGVLSPPPLGISVNMEISEIKKKPPALILKERFLKEIFTLDNWLTVWENLFFLLIQKLIPDGLKNYLPQRNHKQLEESMFKSRGEKSQEQMLSWFCIT